MTLSNFPPLLLSDEDFEALEAILVSELVPEDCMDLEMLDGFLAGVLLSPRPIAREHWLPAVWSAYGETDFGAGDTLRRVIRLVLAYYNELVTTLGHGDEDTRWTPFCFAPETGEDGQGIGDAWGGGFIQGLDLWPEDWQDDVPDELADAVLDDLKQITAPWEGEDSEDEESEEGDADDETRIARLQAAGDVINDIFLRWRAVGLPAPAPIALEPLPTSAPEPGRNEACPCGSGKKYKHCCGAERD
ncbi:MAG: UPF0149 family protein [Azoarcus sp.]|jgi:uncharacterized protein|nr:UPF0149 family protein [Azoarcus sp.]